MRYNFACVTALYLRDPEAAMDLLEPVFEEITISLYRNVLTDPDLDSLRKRPRFRKMLAATAKRLRVEPEADAIPAASAAPPRL